MARPPEYAERLTVPLRWWVQATMLLVTVWLAFIVATPEWVAWTASLGLLALTFGLFAWAGAARVRVGDGVLQAGRAHIEVHQLGEVVPLDATATRNVHGVEADARAFLLTRPYLKRAVRVAVADPDDPTPYWLLSSRRPERLAEALRAEISRHGGRQARPASD